MVRPPWVTTTSVPPTHRELEGIMAVFVVVFIGTIVLIGFLAVRSNKSDDRKRRAATSGTTHVKTVKSQWVNQTVRDYTSAGWEVVGQSSAKSFGSQAQVTITFRKR
jgi:hypothetical protein